jgi:hypothetical protein
VCALSAIVNLTYRNPAAQLAASSFSVVPNVLCFLSDTECVDWRGCVVVGVCDVNACAVCMCALVPWDIDIGSPAVTKAAAFCVGNLVRHCRPNAVALAAAGGAELLVDVMNDIEDDEVSKKVCVCHVSQGSVGLVDVRVCCVCLSCRRSPRCRAAARWCWSPCSCPFIALLPQYLCDLTRLLRRCAPCLVSGSACPP